LQQNKNEKKGTATTVPFCLLKKPREEGSGSKATIAFFFLQQNKTKRRGRQQVVPFCDVKKKKKKGDSSKSSPSS
jgi:hypothetical protein